MVKWTDEDFKKIENMCAIHCTEKEIAGVMGVSLETLKKCIKEHYGLSFKEVYEQAMSIGNLSLRRAQWKTAENGNVIMQIFLGKQWLGQVEKVENNNTETVTVINDVPKRI